MSLVGAEMCKRDTTYPPKKQYKVHFGATSWVVCLGHANTFPCKKQYKVPKLDHARAPRDHCQSVFDMDGGGAGIWPSVCRPTIYHDGHTSRLRIGFRQGWWGPTCVPMCAVTSEGAPGARSARPAHAEQLPVSLSARRASPAGLARSSAALSPRVL